MKVEVRCCCMPQKLLGWLEVPSELVFAGNVVRFRIPPRASHVDRIGATIEREQKINLPVEVFIDGAQHRLALKSEETRLETLRRLSDFIENVTV